MDSTLAIPRDEAAARHRFENFKLGKVAPSGAPGNHGHSRSHSRNKSISNSISSFSFPVPSKPPTVNDVSHFSFPPSTGTTPTVSPLPSFSPTAPSFIATSNPAPSTKRNSHHRRRSSVSTRHESAELMGVALPDLPLSTSDDNVNLGEKDSIRRRALWALEGKQDISYNKVEIPDFSTPDKEQMMFDFSSKPSLASGSGSGYGNTLMGSKRDSFKLLGASSSSKDQLHTLVEEEEEEEEEEELSMESTKAEDSLQSPAESVKENLPPPNTPVPPAVAVTKATPAKHRPSNLNLRPLSLTPDNLITTMQGLPTPTLTPGPRTGLRSLSLTPSSAPSEDSMTTESVKQSRRSSLVISPSPPSRRPVLNLAMDQIDNSASSTCEDDQQRPVRRSSISYKRSSTGGGVILNSAGLPTPEMTPTFGRRYSNAESVSNSSNGDDEFFPNPPTQSRPLSASEQHFLVKSHHALLARITDLERTLSMRRRESGGYSSGGSSRPMSVASNFSSSSDLASATGSEPPSDEMLNLIADLKAERDELKRDVDGWRQRVGNLESQTAMLAKRVDNERRDAWVARSRVGLLEVEKNVLTKKLEAVDELIGLQEQEKVLWDAEKKVLKKENEERTKRVAELEAELANIKKELETERAKKAKEIDPLATPTPRSFDNFSRQGLNKKHGLGFMSVDSESSSTEFDPDSSDDGPHAFGFALKAVQESDESFEDDYSEDENGLAGYEDEEDTDMSLQSLSSFDSDDDDMPRTTDHLQHTGRSSPSTPTRPVFAPPRQTHVSRATLSRTWTFPKGTVAQSAAPHVAEKESVDRFFGCLDDMESDTTGSGPSSPSAYSYEKSKGLFASGFKFAPENDAASFFLPGNIGMPADDEAEKGEKRLSVVAEAEEDEDDFDGETKIEDDDEDMFGEAGGIRITFTPPQEEEVREERKQIQISPVKSTSLPPTLPALDFSSFDEDDDATEDLGSVIPISFDRPLLDETELLPPTVPGAVPVVVTTPPSSIPRVTLPSVRPASPTIIPPFVSSSSIPRATTSRYSFSAPPNSEPTSSTLAQVSPIRAVAAFPNFSPSSFVTPPNKRGGASPSFIPQPVSSPSPIRTLPASVKLKVVPNSTFIRQPSRKPLLPSTAPKGQSGTNVPSMNPATNARSFRRSPDPISNPAASVHNRAIGSAQMKSIDLSHDNTRHVPVPHSSPSPSSTPSIPSITPPLAARLSFQTLTTFNPFSWKSRTSSASVPSQPLVLSFPCHSTASSLSDHKVVGIEVAPRRSGGYVSREKQLRLLKARLEVEGTAMRTLVNVQCKRCDGEIVFI